MFNKRPPLVSDLVEAQGLAFALIGCLLEDRLSLDAGEFGRLLGLLATVTAETNDRQGDILGVWAALASGPPTLGNDEGITGGPRGPEPEWSGPPSPRRPADASPADPNG